MDLQQLLDRLKAAGSTLRPRQLVTLALAFVAVAGCVVGTAYWASIPTYSILFSDLDAESAGTVVSHLKASKIAYTIDDGGRTVRVPAERVDELRLEFAAQGMPTAGRIGFEIFDRTAFGVTDFLEHVNYRRALEGELARTIATIGEVASARVHIAMPRPSVFTGQDQAAKASVVLKLRTNRPLAASTVNAITGLVSAGVEGLRPEAVVVIDTFGRPLARPNENAEEATSGLQIERQQRIEHDMAARVVGLIEPIVGTERVRVNISAKLNPDSEEETEERWDPTPVVRSKQSVSQATPGASAAASSTGPTVAGARGNMPPDQSTKPGDTVPGRSASTSQAAAPANVATHSSETTNYEVSKLTRHRVQPRGQIARLSVAVVLDDDHVIGKDKAGKPTHTSKPRSAADIQKIHDVVAAAVGFDPERGDQLTVENIAFEEPSADEPVAPGFWSRYGTYVLAVLRIAGIVLLGLVALFGVIRPLVRNSFTAEALPVAHGGAAGQPVRTVQDLEGEIDAELEAELEQHKGSRRLPALTKRVATLTHKEPDNAARLLRSWLTEDDR